MTTDLTKQGEFDFGIDMSDMMTMIMMVIMVSVLTSVTTTATQTTQALQAQAYQGVPDNRTLNATSFLQWVDLVHGPPYTSWISAFFENNGPSDVQVAINYPSETFTIVSGGTAEVDRRGAVEKISVIFFKCEVGPRATIVVQGEY